MADAPVDAQCDIRMSFDEWRRVNDKPLFFLAPERIQHVLGGGVTIEMIYRSAGGKTRAPLGRDAIRRALEFQPSFLSKIMDIKNVVNSLRVETFSSEHVIAAVFSMPHLNADLKKAGIADTTVAKKIGYPETAVAAARDNYRVPLDFGLKVLKFLEDKVPDQDASRCLTITGGGDRRFIKNTGTRERPTYVFDADHLISAPATGHQWARS